MCPTSRRGSPGCWVRSLTKTRRSHGTGCVGSTGLTPTAGHFLGKSGAFIPSCKTDGGAAHASQCRQSRGSAAPWHCSTTIPLNLEAHIPKQGTAATAPQVSAGYCCIQLKVWERGKRGNIPPCPKSFMAKATRKASTWKCRGWRDREGHKGPCFPPHALNILVF